METKANHLLIGSFVLVLIAGIFAFVIWLSQGEVAPNLTRYRIFFTDSVAGLSVGGDVRFHGVKVGTVKQISIDRDNPERVKVVIEIDANTPLRADSYATLQLQGITGVSFVQISGGSPTAPLLAPNKHGESQKLPSRPSQISQLVQGAPELLSQAVQVLKRANEVFSEQNRQHIAQMLANAADLSGRVAAHGPELDRTLTEMNTGAADLAAAAHNLNEMSAKLDRLASHGEQVVNSANTTIKNVNGLVTGDAKGLLDDSRKTAQSFTKVADSLQAMLAANRPAIDNFSSQGLSQLPQLIGETRQLVAAMSRLVERLNDQPTRLFYGDKAPEKKAP